MSFIPQVSRVSSQEEAVQILMSAKADGCMTNGYPTHHIRKNGETVGYWSFATIPLVIAWHKNDLKARDSAYLFDMIDIVAAERGRKEYMTTLCPDSPYRPLMPKFGFSEFGNAVLFAKEVK